MDIEYRTDKEIEVDQLIELYVASTLGERRPVDDRERMAKMLANADLIVTAWDSELLVGVARSITDWSFCTYLSDLAVRKSHQRKGIGKRLMEMTRETTGEDAELILLAAPEAEQYYPKVGFEQYPQTYIWPGHDY